MINLPIHKYSIIFLSVLCFTHSSCSKSPSFTTHESYRQTTSGTSNIARTARNITVKVSSEHTLGSGILICEKNDGYIVATSQHFLSSGSSFNIQTPDNLIHTAYPLDTSITNDNDVGFLHFMDSQNNYSVAQLTMDQEVVIDSEVYVAGFPLDLNSGDA